MDSLRRADRWVSARDESIGMGNGFIGMANGFIGAGVELIGLGDEGRDRPRRLPWSASTRTGTRLNSHESAGSWYIPRAPMANESAPKRPQPRRQIDIKEPAPEFTKYLPYAA